MNDSEMGLFIRYLDAIGVAALILLALGVIVLGGSVIHFFLTIPMRRAERARLFLDLLETSIKQGRPVEETIISLAQSRDLSMGVRFHLVAAWIEQNLTLTDALAKVPRFLPPQVNAMLAAGRKIGDLGKVLPACRQLLKDAVSQTRGAVNYLIILTLVITPSAMFVTWTLKVLVLPKFIEIGEGMLESLPTGIRFLNGCSGKLILLQAAVLILLWLTVIIYTGGPRFASWFPVLQHVHYRLPWRRKRMQRDFSAMLAILLDSGVPEPEAVALAADCTANSVFRDRAARALEALKKGMTLNQAVQVMDDTGEFGWRLANAFHGRGGFLRALAGWHESLDAKAFQQEQAAAHGVTSALVLWSGLFVGVVVISVFGLLVSIVNWGVLW